MSMYGIIRYDKTQYGMTCYGYGYGISMWYEVSGIWYVVSYSMVWYVVWYVAQRGMECNGIAWQGMEWHVTVWYAMV